MTIENTSGLIPLGRAVLVRYYEPEKKGSLIVIPESVQERSVLLEQRAQVIAIGSHCWPDEAPRAKVGDYVLISKMAGYGCRGPGDNQLYRFVNDRDIFAGITNVKE